MKLTKGINHRTQIFLAVLVIFLLLVPPLIYFSLRPFRTAAEDSSKRHTQNLQSLASLAVAGADAPSLDAAVREVIKKETEASSGSLRKAERFAWAMFLAGGLFTALLTTSLIIRRLVGPLISLCSQIRNIPAHPSRDVKIDVQGAAEFQHISEAFNRHMELLQEKDRQLLHAQQMELAGLLASGMVHEFNTVLTIVRGFAEHIRRGLPPEDPLQKSTGHIVNAVDRGYHLTRALRPFQREGLIQPEPVDLNVLILQVREEQEKLVGLSTAILSEPFADPLWVMGDRHYLQQVLINVINNARDAMPDGGVIRIANKVRALDEEALRGYDWASPGGYAGISITDSGIGMDQSTIDRIFQPFFTTKEIGQGTGLGLTMAYGIIREHKGFITVRSEAENGTEVTIYMPTIAHSS